MAIYLLISALHMFEVLSRPTKATCGFQNSTQHYQHKTHPATTENKTRAATVSVEAFRTILRHVQRSITSWRLQPSTFQVGRRWSAGVVSCPDMPRLSVEDGQMLHNKARPPCIPRVRMYILQSR
ncbi:hypothetical protein BR93DRAFT_929483 [Coniochaeta sp. PMI_546]|nr:hypothetical protein BR93DRAFT_929483 [Coniochaeta sp. PMI_546]